MDDFDDFDDADYAALDSLCAQYTAPQPATICQGSASANLGPQFPANSTLGCAPQPCLAQQHSAKPPAQPLPGVLSHHTGPQESRHLPYASIPNSQSTGDVLKEHNAVSVHAAAQSGAGQKASGASKKLQHDQYQHHHHYPHEHQQQQQHQIPVQVHAPTSSAPTLTLSQPLPAPGLHNSHCPPTNPQHPAALSINGAQAQSHGQIQAPRQHAPSLHQAFSTRSGLAHSISTASPLLAPTPPQGAASGNFQHLRFSGSGAPPSSAASLGFPTLALTAPAPALGTVAPAPGTLAAAPQYPSGNSNGSGGGAGRASGGINQGVSGCQALLAQSSRPWQQQQQQLLLQPPSISHRPGPLASSLSRMDSHGSGGHEALRQGSTSSGGGSAPSGSGSGPLSGSGSGSALAHLLGGARGPPSGPNAPANHAAQITSGGGAAAAAAATNPLRGLAMGGEPGSGAGAAPVNPFLRMAMGSGGQRPPGAAGGPASGSGSGPHRGSGDGVGAGGVGANGVGSSGTCAAGGVRAGVGAGPGGRPVAAPVMGPPVTVFGTLGLASSTHCSLKLSPSTPQLQEVLRSFQGASFDIGTCAWMIPIRSYYALRERMDNTPGVNMSWKELPHIVHNVLKATFVRKDDSNRYERMHTTVDDAGQSLDERMMPFQREGVRFGLKQGGRVLIGDEMGLGKTVQGCALLKCYEDEWPALIITPSSLRQQWCLALQQWSNALECDVQVVFDKNDMNRVKRAAGAQAQKGARSNVALPFRILIISYDYVAKMSEILLSLAFKCVLLDEAHYIKSFSSQRTKASLPLLQRAKRAILLTGTPALSKPVDLMTLMQALAPGAHIKLNDFAARYCTGDMYSKTSGAKNQQELFRLITATMMIRRRKDDVLKQLPPKRRQQVYLKVDERDLRKLKGQQEELSGLKDVLSSVSGHTGGLLAGLHMEQQQAIMRMYHDTAKLKVAAVQEYIQDLLESDIKFLVFAHHHSLLDGIEKAINTAKKGYIRIDGRTDARHREDLRARFQGDDSVKVAVLGIAAAGVGLTLTAARTVVFAELSWVPGEIMQAEDRVHRIGQGSNAVNIQFLLVKDTIDDIMWDTVQHKLTNVGKVLDGKEDSLAVASRSTVERSSRGAGPMDAFLTRRPDPNASVGPDASSSPSLGPPEEGPTQGHKRHTSGPALNVGHQSLGPPEEGLTKSTPGSTQNNIHLAAAGPTQPPHPATTLPRSASEAAAGQPTDVANCQLPRPEAVNCHGQEQPTASVSLRQPGAEVITSVPVGQPTGPAQEPPGLKQLPNLEPAQQQLDLEHAQRVTGLQQHPQHQVLPLPSSHAAAMQAQACDPPPLQPQQQPQQQQQPQRHPQQQHQPQQQPQQRQQPPCGPQPQEASGQAQQLPHPPKQQHMQAPQQQQQRAEKSSGKRHHSGHGSGSRQAAKKQQTSPRDQ